MKKGIEAWADWDNSGRWVLKIKKKRGTLTLQEIHDTAREYEWDFYLLLLDCYHDPDDIQGFGDEPEGDLVTLYRTNAFYEGL